ncbi:hypothetical protein BDQ17DRAFT_1389159 [Cyathus striatus]|nr:hypothetical protein BDQ17DRAFT_1389159 [Cyathus striatus]
MLDVFKIKPFELEPVFASWKDAPQFNGNPKDLPVDDWLEKIRLGCIERHVPEEYWYKVAQHYMGPKAKARLEELKQVVAKVHGGNYRWTWKKFKVAMQNMGWGIDQNAKQTIKVQGKSSGLWFMRKKDDEEPAPVVQTPPTTPPKTQAKRAPPARSNTSFWLTRKPTATEQIQQVEEPAQTRRPPKRSATDSSFWPIRRNSNQHDNAAHRLEPLKAKSDTSVVVARPNSKSRSRSNSNGSNESGEVTTVTQAPVWLLNACTALEYITSEHPKTMSVISAILITAGSIPSLPAISAGAGGAILASGTAHAIGAIAVGLGQALGATVKNSQEQHAPAASRSH